MYYILRLYGCYRFKRVGEESLTILLCNGVGTLLYMAVLFLFRIVDFSRLALVLFCLLGGSGVLAYIICALVMPDEPDYIEE